MATENDCGGNHWQQQNNSLERTPPQVPIPIEAHTWRMSCFVYDELGAAHLPALAVQGACGPLVLAQSASKHRQLAAVSLPAIGN